MPTKTDDTAVAPPASAPDVTAIQSENDALKAENERLKADLAAAQAKPVEAPKKGDLLVVGPTTIDGVLHKGDCTTADDLKRLFGEGVDVQRLLDLGALRPATLDEAEAFRVEREAFEAAVQKVMADEGLPRAQAEARVKALNETGNPAAPGVTGLASA